MPHLWLLTGANGAGKSTFYRTVLAHYGLAWINADEIAAQMWPDEPEAHSYTAAQIAADLRDQAIADQIDFVTETVFSHPSKLALLHTAKSAGYHITLVYIHLSQVQLNVARVHQRVIEGGHAVPEDKITQRAARLSALIREAIAAADDVLLIDNSDDEQPLRLVATIAAGVVDVRHPVAWLQEFLAATELTDNRRPRTHDA